MEGTGQAPADSGLAAGGVGQGGAQSGFHTSPGEHTQGFPFVQPLRLTHAADFVAVRHYVGLGLRCH